MTDDKYMETLYDMTNSFNKWYPMKPVDAQRFVEQLKKLTNEFVNGCEHGEEGNN